ncbi:hypothetical protein [Haloarcula argentinensis]|uniref:hypothetical protein n=1 Tax=Haloarcula argentinensis TaxID=43776 RepID=UPI001F106A82|nr:hypothetical protein [Haloarcula argentinensis]
MAIDLVEPATVKKPIDHVYCISVLLDMLRLSQKELMCFTLGEYMSYITRVEGNAADQLLDVFNPASFEG